ncbi:hypothetical protein Hanom_Chr06g00525881 [Helianthus anomalus]
MISDGFSFRMRKFIRNEPHLCGPWLFDLSNLWTVNEFHNQADFLSNPPADQAELFGSLIRGLNNCPLTHALRTNPMICSNCINAFWNTAKINRQGAGSIEATIQKTKIVISESVIREVLD